MAGSTPLTTAATATPSVRSAVLAATTVSVVTLLVATFELSMADWPSRFVLLGILPLVALSFFGCDLWSATLLTPVRRGGVKFAAQVEAGDLKPNVDTNENLIALGDDTPHVSAGGNDIVIDQTDLARPEALFHRLPARAVRRRSQKILRVRRQAADAPHPL